MIKNFREQQKENQINWWKNHSSQLQWENEKEKWGKHGDNSYSHITKVDLPDLLWEGIAEELPKYIKDNQITVHSAFKHLNSSWVAAANLYFPARSNPDFRKLLLDFLRSNISTDIIDVVDVELEFALEGDLSPERLLGEIGGSRGSGQTSPDVTFIVTTKRDKGLILTECKYTEDSFYRCSARRKKDREDKTGNRHPEKCMLSAASCNYEEIPCHQKEWGRKYLDYFKLSDYGKSILTRCPAATAGYQLLRQQALGNGINESGKYDLVFSAVAFDKRNTRLMGCLKRTGVKNFQTEWGKIYQPGAEFKTWYHQDWVEHVRKHHDKSNETIKSWLGYMEERYGY
jgi:hypothetical protein